MGRRADEKYWTTAKRIDTELKMALADGRPYELQNEIAFVLQEAVTGECLSELSRLRVIEREHGEMRATLRAIVEHQDLVGGTMGAMSVTRKMAAVAISRLTPPAKAEGEGE